MAPDEVFELQKIIVYGLWYVQKAQYELAPKVADPQVKIAFDLLTKGIEKLQEAFPY